MIPRLADGFGGMELMHRMRVLVVDDDQEVVNLIRSLLGKAYESRGARDGQEALVTRQRHAARHG